MIRLEDIPLPNETQQNLQNYQKQINKMPVYATLKLEFINRTISYIENIL